MNVTNTVYIYHLNLHLLPHVGFSAVRTALSVSMVEVIKGDQTCF